MSLIASLSAKANSLTGQFFRYFLVGGLAFIVDFGSLLYLTLPTLIFFIGIFRPAIGIMLAALTISGISPFIDGRANIYGDDFLKHHMVALSLKAPDGLLLALKKYHIQWTLLPPNIPAVILLDHLPEWHRLYADKLAVVHVKKTALEEAQRP